MKRARQWVFRLKTESKKWPNGYFLTLTYAPESLPYSFNGLPTFNLDHLRLFFKSLRKRFNFSYYLAAEYGGKGNRPHYHVILMGDISLTPQAIQKRWPHGHVHFGDIQSSSLFYTVTYIDGARWQPQGELDDRLPEFSRVSRGIGRDEDMERYIASRPNDQYVYVDGVRVSVPRYYKKHIFKQNPALQDLFLVHYKNFKHEKKQQQHTDDDVAAFFIQYDKRKKQLKSKA